MNRKIKVLYTVPNFNTAGSGRVTFKIATNINRDIFEPEICCLHDTGPFFQIVKNSDIPLHIFPYLAGKGHILSKIVNVWKTTSFFKQKKIDIIHSMNYMSEFSEAVSAKLAGIPWVYSKNNMSWGRKRWKIKTFLSNAVFAQNTSMIHQFYNNNSKVHWVTDGVDLKEFCPAKAKPEILEELKLTNSRNIITVANLVPIKKIETLIESFSLIAEEFKASKLIIVGADNNEYSENLKNQSVQLNLSSRIIFTGKKLNVVDYLNAAEIFVLPTDSLGEGSPVALMEAIATKLYAIGSKVSGITDQLAGLPDHMFQPNNVFDLAEKLKISLSMDQTEFERHINLQYKNIDEKFDLGKEIKILEKVYLNILNKNSSEIG